MTHARPGPELKTRTMDDRAEPGTGGDVLRWPAGFSPAFSDVCARRALVIDAPPSAVFSRLVTVSQWERDFSAIRDARLLTAGHERLEPGSAFRFEIDGLRLDAQVSEFVAGSRLAWFGLGIDIAVYHAWVVSGELVTSRVVAGFAARGAAAIALREPDPGGSQRTLDRWLADLKAAAQSRPA